ncbi:hypothetical protein H4R99_003044 [Coemansia sp. RSA 1722]|nr:hypothetical protein H4R99_003044 [Coemansia sp. RSA 1722]KAJ2639541.1 hypothetical protein GGF40_000783 [Coemansia sp. RSA 1286]
MNFNRMLLSMLLALLSLVLARGAPVVGPKTHILDEQNFETTTRSGTWIIKHYSPSCMHCMHFRPKWEAVVSEKSVELFDKEVYFGEVNCLENVQLCQLNMADSWPMVIVFRDGKRVDQLVGDKSEAEFRGFVSMIASPNGSTALATVQRKYLLNSVPLDASNFTQSVEKGVWLVKMYSPTCPHCRAMAPDWTKMTDELAGQLAASSITFAELNCPENRKVCEANHVDGYPTVNLFVDGVYIEEMTARYKYPNMKEYSLDLVKRIDAGDFAKAPPAPAVNNDNRDWDDNDDEADKNKAEEKPSVEQEAPAVVEEPVPQYNVDGEVVTLTRQNFAERTAAGPWFIKFYAPWCGHCKHLAPTWIKLAEAAKGKVNVGEVNCDEDNTLCTKYNVQGYPSLKLLWEGEAVEFKSSRDLDTMVGFIDNILAQPNTAHSISDLRLEQSKNDVVYVFTYNATDKSAKTKAALSHVKLNAQKLFQSKKLNLVTDLEVAREISGSAVADLTTPKLVVLKDGKVIAYEGLLSSDDQLHEWFYAERFPLLPELDRENSDDLFYDSDYLVLAVLDTTRGDGHVSNYREVAREAAIEYTRTYGGSAGRQLKSSVRFAWVDGTKWEAYVDRVFRLKRSDWPAIVIAQPGEDRFFTTDTKGLPIEASKMGIFLAARAAVEGRLRAKSTNSIIVQAIHVGLGALAATFAMLFGSVVRTLATLSIAAFVSYALYRRSTRRSQGESFTLVKGD